MRVLSGCRVVDMWVWRAGEPQGVHQDEPHAGTRGDAGGGAAGRASGCSIMFNSRDVHFRLSKGHRSWLACVMELDPRPTSLPPPAPDGRSSHTFSALSLSLGDAGYACARGGRADAGAVPAAHGAPPVRRRVRHPGHVRLLQGQGRGTTTQTRAMDKAMNESGAAVVSVGMETRVCACRCDTGLWSHARPLPLSI